MASNHLILCRPLLLPSVFPNIRVFPNEPVLYLFQHNMSSYSQVHLLKSPWSWANTARDGHFTCCCCLIAKSVQLFATLWTATGQASLSFNISQSLLKLMSIESLMPSNYLIFCNPLLLPSVFPNIRIFSNGLALWIRWPKYWSFSFSIKPSNEYSGLISFRMGLVGSPCSSRDS